MSWPDREWVDCGGEQLVLVVTPQDSPTLPHTASPSEVLRYAPAMYSSRRGAARSQKPEVQKPRSPEAQTTLVLDISAAGDCVAASVQSESLALLGPLAEEWTEDGNGSNDRRGLR
jgi:hypothetical protein